MRLVVAAIGRLKDGPERELAERYRKRAEQTGRRIGFRDMEVVEIRESRAQEVGKRLVEESIALANVIPDTSSMSAGKASKAPPWRHGSDAGATMAGPPRCSSLAAMTGWRQACATRQPCAWRSAPPPGRTSSCGSCCWSRFIAPSAFFPGIRITEPDVAFRMPRRYLTPR
jgi:hypothetical protein